jgi:hypothetical protein
MWKLSRYKAGERVVVRSKEEILATLDANGCIDNMPFMPEMLQFCGKELPVWAVAHKTCDTVNKTGGRSLDRTVHLRDSLCDGSAHGGCEAECNLFWNDAWLKPANGSGDASLPPKRGTGINEEQLMAATQARQTGANGAIRYVCQATQIPQSTRLLRWWNVRQYWIDIRTRNYGPGFVLRTLLLAASRQLLRVPFAFRIFRAFNHSVHRLFTGKPSPYVAGAIPAGQKTPSGQLDLQPGEWVRIKPAAEIAATLNVANKNRGMWFDSGQVPNCGRTFRVHRRVSRIIDERNGEMMSMQNPCITLHGTLCNPELAEDRLLCPRNITAYWREIWLERTEAPPGPR